MDEMDEIVHEFLVESYENLDQLDQDLVALESDPSSRVLLSSIFRTVHTIKGTSGFLGFSSLERVSHVGESLLSELRDGERVMDPQVADVLLALVDTLRAILAQVEAGSGDDVDVEPMVARIVAVQEGTSPVEQQATGEPENDAVAPEQVEPEAPVSAVETVSAVESGDIVETVAAVETGDTVETVAAPPAPAAPTAPAPAPASKHEEIELPGRNAADGSIRVDVDLLDSLVRQVGELVLVRNQFDRIAGAGEDQETKRSAQRLSLIASELQEGVMRTRMQPIEHVWSKMPRIVRDLAKMLGREVRVEMTGGDTELDRSLLEAVKDPLTHLVRNAVDHGIEAPDQRRAVGKASQGVVALRAYHSNGQVVVEITDDGAGIDPEKVGRSAVSKGLRSTTEIAAMSSSEVLDLLFLPGFSTAAKVTNVSGRGVGMDVVRTNIEAIGGSVDVESSVGKGTTWRMRIPLTLAIMPALTVTCCGSVYAIPQVSLLELVALGGQDTRIEHVGTAPVFRLRGTLLPLVSLAEVLDLDPEPAGRVIAVVEADDQRFGVIVDRVLNMEEIVVKGLASRLKQIGMYSGATVLGDGGVALILDLPAIARRVLSTEIAELAKVRRQSAAQAAKATQQVLVVAAGDRRVAIPLSAVTRLERIRTDRIEQVGTREVLQYRGALVPLVRLDRVLGAVAAQAGDELDVVVYTRAGRSIAMAVSEILDIVEDDARLHSDIDDHGLVGSTVLDQRVTELLDVHSAVRAADAGFFDDDGDHPDGHSDRAAFDDDLLAGVR
ncbi:chemotaxis protein CheA [Oerskovia turbata]|uniref:histidine kinase n=2 Tax=Oerskovia turbata TaxID=1713 RepID=A0A4Q1KYH6_9CELL|nr:chemotaxis protein CheA [Oerskovia turbata]RXR35287.1 chemotaxis protein CheA [Oerskovia turbata]TGJ95235.1 chemotaxis protein CheA [Actinotalea fermentans ATCC 43279 = JCM 9966 = DSM 3133]